MRAKIILTLLILAVVFVAGCGDNNKEDEDIFIPVEEIKLMNEKYEPEIAGQINILPHEVIITEYPYRYSERPYPFSFAIEYPSKLDGKDIEIEIQPGGVYQMRNLPDDYILHSISNRVSYYVAEDSQIEIRITKYNEGPFKFDEVAKVTEIYHYLILGNYNPENFGKYCYEPYKDSDCHVLDFCLSRAPDKIDKIFISNIMQLKGCELE